MNKAVMRFQFFFMSFQLKAWRVLPNLVNWAPLDLAITKEDSMRSLILAGFAVAGFGLLSASSTIAAPAGGTVLTPLSTASPVSNVRCRTFCRHRWYSRRRCWRQCW